MNIHNFIYDEWVSGSRLLIDETSPKTWILRVLYCDATMFHCHVKRKNEDICYVEIAYSKFNTRTQLRYCNKMVSILGFKYIEFERAVGGNVHIIKVA